MYTVKQEFRQTVFYETYINKDKSMPISDESNNLTVQQVSTRFLQSYKDDEFLNIIRKHGQFAHTLHSGSKIANKILKDNSEVHLKTCIDNPITIASTSISKKTISFNECNLELPKDEKERAQILDDRMKTLMHEYIHTLGYKHWKNGNNWYNRRTAPYVIGQLFLDYVKSKEAAGIHSTKS